MSDYKKQYDEKLKAFSSNFKDVPSLTKIIPDLTRARIQYFLRRTSTLLGNVDKGKVRRPAYLAHGNGNLADFAIKNLDAVPPNSGNASGFISDVLVPQLEFQRKLEFAIGLPGREYEGFRQQAADEIRDHVAEAETLTKGVKSQKSEIAGISSDVGKSVDALRARVDEASLIISRAEKFRERLEKLDGDARRADSIEKLVRAVRKKVTDVEETVAKIGPIQESAELSGESISGLLTTAQSTEAKISVIEEDANKILGLASQAGLAKSYISERSKLEMMKLIYTGIFYVGILLMAAVAYIYVLPAFEKFVDPLNPSATLDVWQRTLILAIRSAILGPFVWAIIFTSSRIRRIEILEMDYAEKAAASLAYHGYKSEMEADVTLLDRLKNGLLVRFSEHPERLLRKKPPTTEIEAGNGLFRMFSGSGKVDDCLSEDTAGHDTIDDDEVK